MVFFVKYEFWYNHLKCARRNGAKIYGVSSLFRPSHRFFKWYGGFFRKALRLFDHFYTQDQRSKELLNSIGIDQVTVTGDTRYDRMLAVKAKSQENEIIRNFVAEKPVLILGSSWTMDEEILVPALSELREKFKIIIAPHDISAKHIEQISAEFDHEVEYYTAFENLGRDILILDTIGQLTNAYQYADLAYIGGGFTGKLHNILEPGAFGIPIFFGPKHARFPEAQLFLDHEVAFTIEDSFSFEKAVEEALGKRAQINEKLAEIFAKNQGAAKKIISSLS
ncbi:3-deoxy-D-manno-octulosonic acid transferase [Fluviicola sp.]